MQITSFGAPVFPKRVKYIDSPCGFPKFWTCSLAFQKYRDGPGGLHIVTHLVPNFRQKYMDGPRGLHFVTHLVPTLYLLKLLICWLGPNALQGADHRDRPCTFRKLGIKSKILKTTGTIRVLYSSQNFKFFIVFILFYFK
ncbi:hypothetical protein Hanom_Chr03g00271021 [Helianthus anomalus]